MSFITTKLLGYVSGGLLVALLLCGGATWLQTTRLASAKGQVTALTEAIKVSTEATDAMTTIANQRAEDLAGRDLTIAAQSGSIDALALASQEGRNVYTAIQSAADVGARSNESRATALLALPTPAAAERCEAARSLIEQELLNVR